MAKTTPRVDIKDATQALKAIMQENLSAIAQAMINQIAANYNRLIPSKRFDAIKDVKPDGISFYKDALLNAYAVTAADSLAKARKEVPNKKGVRLSELNDEALMLGEFDSLPIDIQKRLKAMLDLLVGTQISDLEKAVMFQFMSSVDSTDSISLLVSDLGEAADDYITGPSIQGAASANAGQIVNEVRLAFFLDDSVTEDVEAFEFVNGDPVSPICQDLAGTVFAKDDPNLNRYWPPLHFNCKSYIVPILKGNLGNKEIESLTPSKDSLNKYVQLSEERLQHSLDILGGCDA